MGKLMGPCVYVKHIKNDLVTTVFSVVDTHTNICETSSLALVQKKEQHNRAKKNVIGKKPSTIAPFPKQQRKKSQRNGPTT